MIKMVVCVTCGAEVTKRSTVSVGDGRACRTHEGVMEQSQALQEGAKKADEQKWDSQRYLRVDVVKPENLMKPRCGCCGRYGISYQKHNMLMLVAMNMFEKEYGRFPNLFGGDDAMAMVEYRRLAGDSPEDNVVIMRFTGTTDDYKKLRLMDYAKIGVEMVGLVGLCTKCSLGTNMENIDTPEITLEQLEVGMVMSEFLQPAIDEMASVKLQKAAERN